jgi:hypothetical protein
VVERLWERLGSGSLAPTTQDVIEEVATHELDPYAAADRLLAVLGQSEAEGREHQEVSE